MDIAAPSPTIPELALAQCLRELHEYAVLRNEADLLANLRRGGDVDLLVGDLARAERVLIRHLGRPVRLIRSAYVTGYSYDWGHIDLLPTLEWRGATYIRAETVLAGRRTSAGGRQVPRIAHEALISWLTSLLFGGFFKERYAGEIHRAVAEDGDALRLALIDAAGPRWGLRLWQAAADGHPERSAGWFRSVRRAVWWRACSRAPARTLRRFAAYVIGELGLRLTPPVPWIAILGSDGSGKSSVLNLLVRRFDSCAYATIQPFHWRPGLVPRPQGAGPVTDPHGQSARGLAGSFASLCVLTFDWVGGYWSRLVHLRAKGYIPAFDRMYFDLAVDPKRYRFGGSPALARAFWWALPSPDLVFFLDAEPDVLWRRKQEVSREELERQRPAYTAIVRQHAGGHVIDGTLPIDTIAGQIHDAVRAWMVTRAAAQLGDELERVPPAAPAHADAARVLAGTRDGGR